MANLICILDRRTQRPGRMHMICTNSFHFCLIDRHMILWYTLFWHIYCETSGWSLDQEGVYVTSCSGALSKLILWGNLLASDPYFYAIKTFDFDYDALWVDDMLFYYIDIDRCYWLSFIECARFWTSRMQRHRCNHRGLTVLLWY